MDSVDRLDVTKVIEKRSPHLRQRWFIPTMPAT
jgi:hypothetical protein